jgi:hypothetical protein
VTGCEARGQRGQQRVRDHRRRLVAGLVQQRGEPAAEGRGFQPLDRLGLAEAGHVRHDDQVALGEAGDHRRPVDPAALDPAVQQQRRALPGLQHRGGDDAGHLEPALLDGQAFQEPVARRALRLPLPCLRTIWPLPCVGGRRRGRR